MTENISEQYRPQFHFTAKKNWLNDPNGMVYYKGEYHLFFQHNPASTDWGDMHWGHAVSKDLVHWQEIAIALAPDEYGTCYSGSAVVDIRNVTGLQQGNFKTLLAFYTGAKEPFVQCMAYSNDRGRTWKKYDKNPVVPSLEKENRDPKVFWHELSHRWIMVLWVKKGDENGIEILSSANLTEWSQESWIGGYFECPDLFELPLDGVKRETRWVILGADGEYQVGSFDGREFKPESEKLKGDWGKNYYAAQTFSDILKEDGRRIQIAWMRGGEYPGMPFNQQMSFPVELTLKTFADGVRLCKQPVREIHTLYEKPLKIKDVDIKTGENPLKEVTGELFDISLDVDIRDSLGFGLRFAGAEVRYRAADNRLSVLGSEIQLQAGTNRLQLRILLDRTSIEVFAEFGSMVFSSCFLPNDNRLLEFFSLGGTIRLVSLQVVPLISALR